MAIEAGASIVIVGEHPDNGKFYKIGEVRQDGWILTTDNHLFHHQFFDVCSPPEPRPKASTTPKRAKCSTPYFSQKVRSLPPEALQNEGLNRALASKHKRQCVDLPRLKIIIN